jgi:NTE family protein
VTEAVMASAAVPGLLRPAEVDGLHYLDGGIVNSIPVGRAVECGATTVFVLQVGRVDRPLTPPTRPWEVARVSFEIARRHRFHREMAALPEHVTAHVLPTGSDAATTRRDDSLLGYRDFGAVMRRIDAAYDASSTYLREHV